MIMNREIKFRGKRLSTRKWVYGSLIQWKDGTMIIITENREDHSEFYVNPDTVGQYTGLKDRNGKEVYEGDLLSSDGIECEVAYDEYRASFHLIIDKIKGSTPLGDMMRSFGLQVIGNRWDNPELLEDENNE